MQGQFVFEQEVNQKLTYSLMNKQSWVFWHNFTSYQGAWRMKKVLKKWKKLQQEQFPDDPDENHKPRRVGSMSWSNLLQMLLSFLSFSIL